MRPLSAVRNVPSLVCVVPITSSDAVALALVGAAGEDAGGEPDELHAALSSATQARRLADARGSLPCLESPRSPPDRIAYIVPPSCASASSVAGLIDIPFTGCTAARMERIVRLGDRSSSSVRPSSKERWTPRATRIASSAGRHRYGRSPWARSAPTHDPAGDARPCKRCTRSARHRRTEIGDRPIARTVRSASTLLTSWSRAETASCVAVRASKSQLFFVREPRTGSSGSPCPNDERS